MSLGKCAHCLFCNLFDPELVRNRVDEEVFDLADLKDGLGLCVSNPPERTSEASNMGAWPMVLGDSFCGKFQEDVNKMQDDEGL